METEPPLLLVVFGLPGTGKTTLAHALSEALGLPHLNTDRVRTDLQKRGRYADAEKEEVYAELLRRAEGYLENRKGVVLDGTFSRQASREALKKLAATHRARLKWVRTRAGEDVVRERVSKTRPHTQADFGVYRKIRAEFAPPPPGILEVWTDREDADASLHEVLRELKD